MRTMVAIFGLLLISMGLSITFAIPSAPEYMNFVAQFATERNVHPFFGKIFGAFLLIFLFGGGFVCLSVSTEKSEGE